jgi:nitrite reductase/ring-hydroxylating ferredoxin subunit
VRGSWLRLLTPATSGRTALRRCEEDAAMTAPPMGAPPTDRPVARCPLDRRTLLRAAAVTAVAATGAVAAGCNGEDGDGGGASGGGASGSAARAPATPTAALPGGALARAADVPVGGGVVVDSGRVVVAQPSDGVFKAYDARCPHMGISVNPPGADGTPGVILCPGHRATFRAADGSVVNGPANRALSGIPVKVDGEFVVRVR